MQAYSKPYRTSVRLALRAVVLSLRCTPRPIVAADVTLAALAAPAPAPLRTVVRRNRTVHRSH